MATVACPGCGLPRVESELDVKPCPVCESAPVPEVVSGPRVRTSIGPDRAAERPGDGNQPAAPHPVAHSRAFPIALVGAAFAVGALVGVGGVFGLQSLTHKPPEQPVPVERTVYEPIRPPAAPAPLPTPVAPMPRELVSVRAAVETAPPPHVAKQPLPPGRITTVELNEPDSTYVVPVPQKKGEHVVLRGKVKTLRVAGLDLGTVLDATGLEAETIHIARIEGRSTLKLNAPNGVVYFGGWVGGGSVVEVNAPGGEVKFLYPTTEAKPGSRIDGGAAVSITGRLVEFKGDVTGADTKVSVTLTRNAWLKLASVSDHATVEYRSQPGVRLEPDVIIGTVAPTAKFRKE